MAYIDTKHLFKCETCRHSKNGKCENWCENGECYSPNMRLIPTIKESSTEYCSRWVRVAKELPQVNDTVLVYVQEMGFRPYQTTATLIYGEDKFFIDRYGREIKNISHWRPLPESPYIKEEEVDE